jgi:hypothetical protein
LLPLTRHIHLSLASGVDGEGVDFSSPSSEMVEVIASLMKSDCLKVLEVWQGHLQQFSGFKKALEDLHAISRLTI